MIRGIPYGMLLNPLSQQQLDQIHESSLEVLRKTGIRFEHNEARKILGDAGCDIDDSSEIVKFPPGLVEECLRRVPGSFSLGAVDQEYDLQIGGSRVTFSSGTAVDVLDAVTGHRRPAVFKDAVDVIRILDNLERIHHIFLPFGILADKPKEVAFEWQTALTFRYARKSVGHGVAFPGCSKWQIEMADVVGAQMIAGAGAVPPLSYSFAMADAIIRFARKKHAVSVSQAIASGATGPVTLAGTLIQGNAEILAGITLTQIVSPGNPNLYCSYTAPLDMRTGGMAVGAVESAILGAGVGQITRYYRIPGRALFPQVSAMVPDQQSGIERALQLMMTALGGVSIICFAGQVDNEKSMCYEQILIDDELCAMVARIMEGINFTPETMAVDLIHEVGPVPGNFLIQEHTRRHWKDEHLIPPLFNRASFERWQAAGGKDILAVSREKVQAMLAEPPPESRLPREMDDEITRIMEAVEREKG